MVVGGLVGVLLTHRQLQRLQDLVEAGIVVVHTRCFNIIIMLTLSISELL